MMIYVMLKVYVSLSMEVSLKHFRISFHQDIFTTLNLYIRKHEEEPEVENQFSDRIQNYLNLLKPLWPASPICICW